MGVFGFGDGGFRAYCPANFITCFKEFVDYLAGYKAIGAWFDWLMAWILREL
jgi:hypothetical protein